MFGEDKSRSRSARSSAPESGAGRLWLDGFCLAHRMRMMNPQEKGSVFSGVPGFKGTQSQTKFYPQRQGQVAAPRKQLPSVPRSSLWGWPFQDSDLSAAWALGARYPSLGSWKGLHPHRPRRAFCRATVPSGGHLCTFHQSPSWSENSISEPKTRAQSDFFFNYSIKCRSLLNSTGKS